MWSEKVWLALDDGSVKQGSCLFVTKSSVIPNEFNSKIHDWDIDGTMAGLDAKKILAWLPFMVPVHPSTLLSEVIARLPENNMIGMINDK